jgi:hypothetical protein
VEARDYFFLTPVDSCSAGTTTEEASQTQTPQQQPGQQQTAHLPRPVSKFTKDIFKKTVHAFSFSGKNKEGVPLDGEFDNEGASRLIDDFNSFLQKIKLKLEEYDLSADKVNIIFTSDEPGSSSASNSPPTSLILKPMRPDAGKFGICNIFPNTKNLFFQILHMNFLFNYHF